MTQDENKIHKLPFIGNDVCIKSAKNPSYVNIEGKIVDETKFSFIVKTASSKKIVLKSGTIFSINGATITGDKIIGRCEQRIKIKK